MSEKKLKQSRLPFQILTSPKTPTGSARSLEKPSSSPSTPKTPLSTHPRKRKPSTEGENLRQTKIGRLANAKENIAEPETIDLIDSDDEKTKEVTKAVETTPTTNEGGFHIKLPSTTKSRRKQELKVQPIKVPIEEAPGSPDDSIVYLDKEELPAKSAKKVKKSAKKAEKKKKSNDNVKRVKKNLDMEKDQEEGQKDITEDKNDSGDSEEPNNDPEPSTDDSEEPGETAAESSNKNVMEQMDIDDVPQPIEATVSDQITKLINASGTNSSPVKDIQDMLSDDESALNQSLNTSLNSSINQNSDVKKTPRVLTPKQQARQKEFEERRLEKELVKQKEREAKEAQRLKEKEEREEAKRREKEEKEESRRKEKEEREVEIILN